MKQLFFLFALLITLPLFSQKVSSGDVPPAVVESLEKAFDGLKVRGWDLVDDEYQARVRLDGANAYLCFSPDGRFLRTAFPIDPRELPSSLLNYVNERFTSVSFYRSELIEMEDGEEFYFIELRREGLAQGKLSELKFDPMGELLHREDFQVVEEVASVEPKEKKSREPKARKEKAEEDEPAVEPGYPESLVPEKVKTSFARRFRGAEELEWDTTGENYYASFFMGDLFREVHFSKDGEWLMSKEEMDPDRIYSPVSRYILEEYDKSYSLEYAEKITRNDRSSNYYVELSQKIRGLDENPITKLYFDKTGRIEKVEEPVLPEEEEEIVSDLHDPGFEEMLDEDLEELSEGPAKDARIKESELPSGIPTYIYDKYPEIKFREAVIEEDQEWGTVYRVVVSKEGLMQDQYNLFFDRKGNVLEDNVPADLFETRAAAAKEEKEEEVYYEDRTTLPAANVPDNVVQYFERRFPRAEELTWLEEDEYYTARFYYRELLHHTTFDKDAVLLSTKTEMEPDRVYRPILMYVEENYPKYKIDYSEKVIRKDRNNYYYVELYTKKRDLPEMVYLYFDKMGKPIDFAPEL